MVGEMVSCSGLWSKSTVANSGWFFYSPIAINLFQGGRTIKYPKLKISHEEILQIATELSTKNLNFQQIVTALFWVSSYQWGGDKVEENLLTAYFCVAVREAFNEHQLKNNRTSNQN